MAFNVKILLFLLTHILNTASDMKKPKKCNGSAGTFTTCHVAINETVCLVCLTQRNDNEASWSLGRDTFIFNSTVNIALKGIRTEFPDTYVIGCNDDHYSLNVSRRRVPRNPSVYFCWVSGNHYCGFNVTTVDGQPTIKPDEYLQGSNKTNSARNISSGLLALYVSVPCMFMASILTSILLYFKAKKYRQQTFERRRKSENVNGAVIQSEANHGCTASVYADIEKTERDAADNLATLSKSCQITLNTRLKASGIVEYWNASYVDDFSEDQKCFAKTLSSLATMTDATVFRELAKNLKALENNNFVVQLLYVSVDGVPYSIYYEYMECGSLRDFIRKRYQQARKSRMSLPIGKPEVLPANVKRQIDELLTFALMIAEALKFITSQNFSHPALSLKKVLLSECCECKLYDIYPTEMAMTRINYLMKKDDPPVAWMAVETIFLQEYQTSSDVWSFAVLLWELFSLGEVPHTRRTREEVEHEIRNGAVLTQPLCCPGAVYGIMLTCWNNAATKRPTFESLLHKIGNMVAKFKEQ